MSKVSPIAAYLTGNHAITKRQGNNVWHFFSKEGLYLGRQVKIEQNGANAYVREVYGEGLKKLFYECKVLGQKCTYYKDDKSPIGVNVLPVYSYVLTHSIDFINSKFRSVQVEKRLRNQMDLIAIEQNIGVGIYNIDRPFVYDEKKLLDETKEIKSSMKINHTFN
jgi:hypothetical protein